MINFLTNVFCQESALRLHYVITEILRLRPNMRCLEVGSFTGASALTILEAIAPVDGHLYCVDHFRGSDSEQTVTPLVNILGPSAIREHFLANIRESGHEQSCTLINGSSKDVAEIVQREAFDLVFIDADHRYSAVLSDIVAWMPAVRRGGIVCGHDFERALSACDPAEVEKYAERDMGDPCHYGVIKAVTQAFPNASHRDAIWWQQL